MNAPRDPEGRKRQIARAAYELLPEVGVGGLTHRLVAARAEVPLGATTYYYKTLDDLIAAGLAHATAVLLDGLAAWAEVIAAGADLADTLADLTADYLRDRPRILVETELYLAAAHRPGLRPMARAWIDGLTGILTAHVSPDAARAAVVFIDGAVVYALICDRPIDTATLRESLAALLGAHRTA
ncbi:DNA-binding transcriptional regulator [Streptomyces sp. SID3343]|uniref:TetR/AcrR family transcriptional regulator n=1 Tax=Streptomyces sp. SID3343 TaxID=2690260 RepID=UPI00136B3461|nr:DNA-binding transcriptional regulator [Streptomyces sp. SID3343]MYV99102.1 DNA-binding transcriptional regulator [Streptomyces sp. SID3343]